MRYNLYISDSSGNFNILNITEVQLKKAINAYLEGASSITLSGQKFIFNDIDEFKIYTLETDETPEEKIKFYNNNVNFRVKNMFENYLPKSTLALMGKDVTIDLIGDSAYGEKLIKPKELIESDNMEFVNNYRIE
jgi:hypothetical protein